MARRKTRFTRKKKVGRKYDKRTPGGLSEREFAALREPIHQFIVEDSHHVQNVFAENDAVYIKHRGSEESGELINDNHWIGQIRQIRGDGPDNVWIKVQWYWSPEEVAEVIKSFDPSICGKYEKFQSDNFDIVTVHSVAGHVEVKYFDETGMYQVPIGDEEWFTRYEFMYEGRRIVPKVTHIACHICRIPYTPGAEKILHFCPRPHCQMFYHQACLVKRGYVEETRKHRLLETWPDVYRTVSVEELYDSDSSSGWKESHSGCLADFEAELVAIADQPIIRGAQGGGVVGNITSVVAARQFIYRTINGNPPIHEGWKARIDPSTAFVDFDTFPNCTCPNCYSPI